MKKAKTKKVVIEFDENHLPTLAAALETYSRLKSGQIKHAIDTVYTDRNISYEEGLHIEYVIRDAAFPANPQRNYDGHGVFYDQYDNVYDEGGSLVTENEKWNRKKNSPHLDHPNISFGVGCPEMKDGTVAFEIKKTIEEYLHYNRNSGFRQISDVSGDGAWQISNVPLPCILDDNLTRWKPEKHFRIPKKYQESLRQAIKNKEFTKAWEIVNKSFKVLPKGTKSKIEEFDGTYHLVIEKPYKIG